MANSLDDREEIARKIKQAALGGKNRSTLRNILKRMIDWGVVEFTDDVRMYPGQGANICRLLRVTDIGIDLLRPRSLPTAGV